MREVLADIVCVTALYSAVVATVVQHCCVDVTEGMCPSGDYIEKQLRQLDAISVVMRSRVGLQEMEGEGRATVDFYGILGIPLIIQTSPLIITIHRSLIAQ
jgi:hypothetical protein